MKKIIALCIGIVCVAVGIGVVYAGFRINEYENSFERLNASDPFGDQEEDLDILRELDSSRFSFENDPLLYTYHRALIMAREGKYEEARPLFEEVIAKRKKRDTLERNANYNLGVILFAQALDNLDSPQIFKSAILLSKQYFEEALRIDPAYENARFNLEKIYRLVYSLELVPVPGGGDNPGDDDFTPPRPESEF